MNSAHANLKLVLLEYFSAAEIADCMKKQLGIKIGAVTDAAARERAKATPALAIHHLLEDCKAGQLRKFCALLSIQGAGRSHKDLMRSLLRYEWESGAAVRFSEALRAGGEVRYGAILELWERNLFGIDVFQLRHRITDCLFDSELGVYRRVYWLVAAFVDAGHDISELLPKIIERTKDGYRSTGELETALCSYAEKSPANAQEILRIARTCRIPEDDYEEPDAVEADFTATAIESMINELSRQRSVIKAPQWLKQVKLLAEKSNEVRISPQTIQWGKQGVKIGEGRLAWFDGTGGGYSQSYTEFLSQGPKLLWIDRAMPEDSRQKVYAALGTQAPPEPGNTDRENEFSGFIAAWEKTPRAGKEECPTCGQIPDTCSRGENNNEGAWDSVPAEAAGLTPLLRNLSNEEIHGCDTCGRLYAWTHYHDNILGSQEDSDTLTRLDIAALKKRWQKEILEGERVTYLKAQGG